MNRVLAEMRARHVRPTPVAPARHRTEIAPEIAPLFAAGKLEKTCPDCGRWEAASFYCSKCGRRPDPSEWYRNGDLAERARRGADRDNAESRASRPATPVDGGSEPSSGASVQPSTPTPRAAEQAEPAPTEGAHQRQPDPAPLPEAPGGPSRAPAPHSSETVNQPTLAGSGARAASQSGDGHQLGSPLGPA